VRGGHLLPECTVGDIPIEATVRLLHDVAWVSSTCPETMMPAFGHRAGVGCERPQAVFARIRPGVDLCYAVVEVAGRAGFPTARVRAGLGSVVGARLRTGEGRVTEADWPATEFTSLAGTVSDRDVSLAAVAVDRNGDVHSGVVIPGQNPVAVTFELYLEEGAHDGGPARWAGGPGGRRRWLLRRRHQRSSGSDALRPCGCLGSGGGHRRRSGPVER